MKVGKWFFLKKNCIWKHGVTYENNFGKDKEKKTNKRWWKNKGRNEDHNYFLMQTYSIICKVQASLFAILWNWWGKECVKANRERCDCCCWPRFRVWSGIFKKAFFLVHMRVCSLPLHNSHPSKRVGITKVPKAIILNLKIIILIYPIIPWPFEPYSLLAISFAFH